MYHEKGENISANLCYQEITCCQQRANTASIVVLFVTFPPLHDACTEIKLPQTLRFAMFFRNQFLQNTD